MMARKMLLVILLASAVLLASGAISTQLDAAPSAWEFEGRVYSGDVGDESTPLAGVVVSAYGANDPYPATGLLIVTATTDSTGWYNLSVPEDFEYYSIQETTPAGYTSAGATSVSGTVMTADWIEYAAPLDGKTLSGNKFWDTPSLPGGIPLDQVPTAPYRQAAQVLEHARGSGTAPGWEQAQLGPTAYPLYRPDVAGVAYYEFRVVRDAQPAGFIVISTGDHDFPVPHWNFMGESLTQEMERKAQDAGRPAARFYKLDALSYAAEDAAGQLASTVGTLPPQVIGMEARVSQTVELSEARWTPSHPELGDDQPSPDGTFTTSGPITPSWQLREWGSWGELKAGYAASYTVLLEALRQDAAEDWEVENLARQYGEGLRHGEVYTLAMLCETPLVVGSGAGSAHVETAMVTRPGLPPVYRISVTSAVPGQELPLDLRIDCPGRATESARFWVWEPAATLYLPLVEQNVSSTPAMQAQGIEAVQQNWAWYWAWAGTEHQRLYSQIAANTHPNDSDCWSGCGATAWAMLFGWADYQAGTNTAWNYWSGRWGIYRENGGYGNEAVAPSTMDAGVQAMTWEIRGHIDTWCACVFGLCVSDGGATLPSDMDEAADYLKNRSNTRLDTHYNVFGWTEGRLREYARDSILYRKTPAIIGTGWLKHYPLAYGYQWWSKTVKKCFIWCWTETQYNRMFWVNQGWGGGGNGWIPARTWFAGEIYP